MKASFSPPTIRLHQPSKLCRGGEGARRAVEGAFEQGSSAN